MAEEAKFTPRPWKWEGPEPNDWTDESVGTIKGADDAQVCDFGNSTTYYPSNGTEPNPHDLALILAAPDLYTALESILPHLESVGPLPEFESARQVLARARGESHD